MENKTRKIKFLTYTQEHKLRHINIPKNRVGKIVFKSANTK